MKLNLPFLSALSALGFHITALDINTNTLSATKPDPFGGGDLCTVHVSAYGRMLFFTLRIGRFYFPTTNAKSFNAVLERLTQVSNKGCHEFHQEMLAQAYVGTTKDGRAVYRCFKAGLPMMYWLTFDPYQVFGDGTGRAFDVREVPTEFHPLGGHKAVLAALDAGWAPAGLEA